MEQVMDKPQGQSHSNFQGDDLPTKNGNLDLNIDLLIVGGGMSGMYAMWKFRQLGLNVKLFEAGSYFGGAWHWNRYPGARVDSESPYYGLSIPDVYRTWSYTERFPDHHELRKYFAHVDATLDLTKDASFNIRVTGARFNEEEAKWTVQTNIGSVTTCKYLILAVGSTSKIHIPDFKNITTYRGEIFHSARYPTYLDVRGKKVACIGSGATGVQVVQALAREDCQLHAYIRTPNIALPMRQRQMSKDEQDQGRCFYDSWFRAAKQSPFGFPYNLASGCIWDVSPDVRDSFWKHLWNLGGIPFLASNYPDHRIDKSANKLYYDFWCQQTRKRIRDPVKRDIIAPLRQQHWFGTKRPSLEHDYYERIDQDNVTLIDLKTTQIEEFTEKGIQLSDRHENYDIVILATGYDSVTGSLTDMGLVNIEGKPLMEEWANGTETYLGLSISGFPNMFMIHGPQSPISFANAPAVIETQVDWVAAVITKMHEEGIIYLDAERQAAVGWKQEIQNMSNMTLFPETQSWYMGDNVPGKPREQYTYLGGLVSYAAKIKDALEGWEGFHLVKRDG